MGQRCGLSPSLSQKVGSGLGLGLGLSQRDPRGVVAVELELGRPSDSDRDDIDCSRTSNTAKQKHPVTQLTEETAGFFGLYPSIQQRFRVRNTEIISGGLRLGPLSHDSTRHFISSLALICMQHIPVKSVHHTTLVAISDR